MGQWQRMPRPPNNCEQMCLQLALVEERTIASDAEKGDDVLTHFELPESFCQKKKKFQIPSHANGAAWTEKG